MGSFWKIWFRNRVSLLKHKKGDLEIDEIGKVIIGLILLIILIVVITVVIRGEFSNQGSQIKDIFRFS